MSSNEHIPCPSCHYSNSYSTLQDTTNYSCDIPCLCRFDEGRSSKDKMYFDFFVLNKPIELSVQPYVGYPTENYMYNRKN
jgi:hypothetical protein